MTHEAFIDWRKRVLSPCGRWRMNSANDAYLPVFTPMGKLPFGRMKDTNCTHTHTHTHTRARARTHTHTHCTQREREREREREATTNDVTALADCHRKILHTQKSMCLVLESSVCQSVSMSECKLVCLPACMQNILS